MLQNKGNKDFLSVIRSSLDENLEDPPKLIVGVSGGADSMVLLYCLFSLKVPCIVSHINYGMRGRESDMDQELVEQLAFEWGYECHSVVLDPEDAKGNFQHWAREQRYSIFEGLMVAEQADAIAVAHHRDDQLETIMQKILRGSSVSNWSAMNIYDPPLFRPMLNFTKEEILSFCEDHSIPFREDESNRNTAYARNWLRNEWAPKMDELFPGWDVNLLELRNKSDAFRESIDLLKNRFVRESSVSLKKLRSVSKPLRLELWRSILEDAGEKPSKGQLDEIIKLIDSQPGTNIVIGHMQLTRDRDRIYYAERAEPRDNILIIKRSDIAAGHMAPGYEIHISEDIGTGSEIYMDASKLKFPLSIRHWSEGDRFQPLGMTGTQKVSDHLTNRKVHSHLRESALVLCSEDSTIVAILYPEEINGSIGFISDQVKADAETNNYLIIRSKT